MYLSLHVKNIHFDIISYDQLQLHGLIRSSNQQIANHLLKVKYHQLEIIVTTSQNSLYKSGQYNFNVNICHCFILFSKFIYV